MDCFSVAVPVERTLYVPVGNRPIYRSLSLMLLPGDATSPAHEHSLLDTAAAAAATTHSERTPQSWVSPDADRVVDTGGLLPSKLVTMQP